MVKSKGMKVPEKAMGEHSCDLRVGKAATLPFRPLNVTQSAI